MEHYELLKQIGKGSYGKVYTARNYVDHGLYVLKAIAFDGASEADAASALREAKLLALLRHPHIVPYKECFSHDGDLCLVMAHCEGGDLYSHIKSLRKSGHRVDEDCAWQWLVQLLLALSYCHSKRILHRDVKTQNVFMTRDGKLMLGDFGLAKQLQRTLEMARTPIGTPYYMAPEIYEETPYSFKSDVWALGCVFYEVLTGRPAFAADNLSRVVIRVLRGQYDALPEQLYSQELRALVGVMLTRDVHQRPTVDDLLQHPSVVRRVQGYLDELSTAGSTSGWSTWRMKLPPSVVAQMAKIIQRASEAGDGTAACDARSAAPPPPHARVSTADVAPAQRRNPPGRAGSIQERAEDALSTEELMEQYGLQDMMNGAAHKDGLSELEVLSLQLSVMWQKQAAGDVLDAANAPDAAGDASYSDDDWEDAGVAHDGAAVPSGVGREEAAAQLLGTARPTPGGGGGGADGDELMLMLTAGLPKAGFGFGDAPCLGHAVPGAAAPPPPPACAAPQHRPSPACDPSARRVQEDGVRAGAGDVGDVPGTRSDENAPLAPTTPSPNWKMGTALPSGSYRAAAGPNGAAAARLNSTLGPGGASGRAHASALGNGGGIAASTLSLRGALTNRAAFLRDLLRKELGPTGLEVAAAAVRAAHVANGGGACVDDTPLPPDVLRSALGAGGGAAAALPAAQREELAPLLDELVLLQERNFAAR